MAVLMQLFAFVVTILVLVSFHEAGHFVVAKLLGVKVLRFSIGFGKPITRFYDKTGTEYALAWLPLGGYVKLLDEREVVVPSSEKHLAFNRQPLWARTLVVLAGPFTNILFAIIVFWIMFMIGFQTIRPIIGHVKPHSIAAEAGLKSGYEIVNLDGQSTPSLQKVVLGIVERLGETSTMTIEAKDNHTGQLGKYVLNLQDWSVNPLNPAPLESLGILPVQPNIPPIIHEVDPNGPASLAGLQANDRVLAVDGQHISNWYDFVKYVHLHPLKKIVMTYQRGNERRVAHLIIERKMLQGFRYAGYIGVKPQPVKLSPDMVLMQQYSPLKAFGVAVGETWQYFIFNFVILKKMILGQVSLSTLGGPISIFQTADTALKQGIGVFLGFLALISIMLAFVNILPIPGLDGGHLFNYLVEFIIRRPVSLRYEIISVQLGMLLLIIIMLLATLNDILRLIQVFQSY